jgi:hypothetical protein
MPGLLIDDSGQVWPAQPETVARRFGLRRPRDFMVRAVHLGFIFAGFGAYGARVALRPQLVSRAALLRLFDMLAQRDPPRVALAGDGRLSSWEFIIGAQRVIARIEHLVAEARSPSPKLLLSAERLLLDRCLDIAGGRLLPALQSWHQSQGRWQPDLYGRLLKWKLLPFTVISEQPRASERQVIRHWGAGITLFGTDWIRIAPGRDLEDLPNAEIGRWRAALPRQTVAERAPRLLATDFVFRGIDDRLTRVQYTQLDLPWLVSDRTMRVTAVTAGRRSFPLERQASLRRMTPASTPRASAPVASKAERK